MKIIFWISLVCDIIIIYFFSSALIKTYASGIIETKSKADIVEFMLLFAATSILTITASVLYYNQWYKTAALLSSIPFLCLLSVLLIPIIAYISGQRMN